jgi:hypothetical protein
MFIRPSKNEHERTVINMRKTKLSVALLLVVALFSMGMLAGCNNGAEKPKTDPPASNTPAAPSTTTPTPSPSPEPTAPEKEAEEVDTVANISELASAQVGDVVYFGTMTYPKYDKTVFEENVGWRVLASEGGKVLLFSDTVVETRAYNKSEVNREVLPATWETCTLRTWMNGEFYEALPAVLKDAVATTSVVNAPNAQSGESGGNNTEDKVFLLSVEEVEQYFPTKEDRELEKSWWLRSVGRNALNTAVVYDDGSISVGGMAVDDDSYLNLPGVHAAMWVTVQ